MKKCFVTWVFWFILLSNQGAIAQAYPLPLQVTFESETVLVNEQEVVLDVPKTFQKSVDKAVYEALQSLKDELLLESTSFDAMEMTTAYRISGQSTMGFLLMVRTLSHNYDYSYLIDDTISMNHAVLTYDMKSGKKLTLLDVFPKESPVWKQIADDVRAQLDRYYPSLPKNENIMEQWLFTDNLQKMSFLPGAGQLSLVFPLEEYIHGKDQLVHVPLYYADYRQWMTKDAALQCDNSAYPVFALTYDDGPVRRNTAPIMRNLGKHGAVATFFCVGEMINKWPDVPRRALDMGNHIACHTYDHVYSGITGSHLREDRAISLEQHEEIIGIAPTLFRAPGGGYQKYIENEVGWPLIQWTASGGDTGHNSAHETTRQLNRTTRDGSIILLHDIYNKTVDSTAMLLDDWVEKGFLFATVEELFSMNGIEILPDTVYNDGDPAHLE